MVNPMRNAVVPAVYLISILFAAGAHAGGLRHAPPTAGEIAMLPKFCWAHMKVPGATEPEYRMLNCGVGTNHYCGGLIKLIRAKSPAVKEDRVSMLRGALTNVRYTWDHIKDDPKCSIRNHVAETQAEIEGLLKAYGRTTAKAK